jgi:hypothetical protein
VHSPTPEKEFPMPETGQSDNMDVASEATVEDDIDDILKGFGG